MKRQPVSLAKLTPPKLPNVVARLRLFQWLDQARKKHSVIWIKGLPGFGKTTLIASYLRTRQLPALWYQVDEGDADPATLFHYLQLAAKKAAPRYRRLLPNLTPEYLPGIHIFTRRFFEQLYARLKNPAVVVFDNYQNLPGESAVQELLRIGLEAIPEGISLVILSREDPPAALSLPQVRQAVTQLDQESLRLTKTEARALIRLHTKTIKREFGKERLEELYRQTRGWVAALILMLEQATDKEAGIPDLTAPPTVLFHYLATEVLKRILPETQTFLMKTAFLPTMTSAMAAELTEVSGAEAILNALYRKRYFTERRPEPQIVYQYHPLFREFLLSRAKELLRKEQVIQLQQKAASILEQTNRIEESVALYQAAGESSDIVRLVLAHAQTFFGQGRMQTIGDWITRLPSDLIDHNPWLLFWLAQCQRFTKPQESEKCFARAYALFKKQEDHLGMLLVGISVIEHLSMLYTDFRRLDPWLDEFLRLLREQRPFPTPEVEAKIKLTMFMALLWRRPQESQCELWADEGIRLLAAVPNALQQIMMGYQIISHALFCGDIPRAAALRNHFQQMVQTPTCDQSAQVSAYTVEAMYTWVVGKPDSCRKAFTKGYKIADELGMEMFKDVLCEQAGYNEILEGDLGMTKTYLERRRPFTEQNPGVAGASFHYQMAWLAMLKKDQVLAAHHIQVALERIEQGGAVFLEALVRLGAVQVFLMGGNFDEASRDLYWVDQVRKNTRFVYVDFLFNLTKAQLEIQRDNFSEAHSALTTAMVIGRQHGIVYYHFLSLTTLGKLCAYALELGIETEYVKSLIRKRKLFLEEPSLAPDNWPWPIKVFTLGRFAIEIDGQPLHFSGKVPRRPLQLLKVLLANGRTEASETYLADQLWPDAEGDAAHKTLVKTVERLRKVLGPHAVIHLQEGKIRLDPRVFWVDAWTFESLLGQREEGVAIDGQDSKLSNAERGLGLYQGSFLPDDTAEPWTTPLCERLKQKYIRNVARLCQTWSQDGKADQAVRWLEQAVDHEPVEESLYQQWMQTLHALGRQTEVPQVYQRCCTTLQATTGQKPSADTLRIYESCRKTS